MSLFKSLTSINNSNLKNNNLKNIYRNKMFSSKYEINNIQVFYEDEASDAGDDFGNPTSKN
ncbi:expressed protein [Dictyostelium purpureum]|uniref:Expressed protein n=1 Tax=Dictyostelium purpureum TaxID=5786 RepID=F1A577_DICPU|nr:uncharacterized protein DICPUDRAFT_93291 [Dictyostelium purpureum]EGC28650.1 expressed protein [Dictyostelium purpureum]|eukprot:XP_003294821.1 expressed protein [Dictyostelium purpureum]